MEREQDRKLAAVYGRPWECMENFACHTKKTAHTAACARGSARKNPAADTSAKGVGNICICFFDALR